MKDKVLVNVFVPCLSTYYDIFIPINERIHNVTENIKKSVYELSENRIDISKEYYLFNTNTGNIYTSNAIVRETDIKNSTKLILVGF